MRQKKRRGFWNKEYKGHAHLALSTRASEDLQKFTRWLKRTEHSTLLNARASVLDLGCGNGRNLFWLSETFGLSGIGYDISNEAITQAKKFAREASLPLTYTARSIHGPLEVPDESQTVVLDMMTSHFLNEAQRATLVSEIFRVLQPGGFLFYKTFLLDEDRHALRMLRENPSNEKNTYIHPRIGLPEHVSTEEEIEEVLGAYFTIHKIHKSHRHTGKDAKRRSIVVYAQKPLS